MAAIRAALRRVAEQRHTGIVVARGIKKVPQEISMSYPGWWSWPHYAVIVLDHDGGTYTCHDPGEPDSESRIVSDQTVRISRSMLTGDHVTLFIKGNDRATWEPTKVNTQGGAMARRPPSYDWVEPGSLWLDQCAVGSRLCVVKSYAQHVLMYDMDACQIYQVDRRALAVRCSPLGESWGLLTSIPPLMITPNSKDEGDGGDSD